MNAINPTTIVLSAAEPIPLNRGILMKNAGFADSGFMKTSYLSPSFGKGTRIRIRKNSDDKFYYENSQFDPILINSVHELQNLFFVLSGFTELEMHF